MADYTIVVNENGTGRLMRLTLEQLKAELDAMDSARAMRSAGSDSIRMADLPDDNPGKAGMIATFGPDHLVRRLPDDFPSPDPEDPDVPIEYEGHTYALIDENGNPIS